MGVRVFSALISLVVLVSCAEGNCRRKNAEIPPYPGQKEILEGKTPVLSPAEKAKRVSVYKYDGSKQCGLGQAIAVDFMEKELVGLKVLAREKKSDGMMYIQKCGAGTGQANVYEIYKTDLQKAKDLGFKEWKN
jgi:hypothetical protein